MELFIVSIKNNFLLSLVFIVLILIYLSFEGISYWDDLTSKFKVNFNELVLLLNHQKAVIVDIRAEEEFNSGHIVNAINIPAATGMSENHLIRQSKHLPIVIVDTAGKTANAYATKLRSNGIPDVRYLHGGLLAWREHHMPLIKSLKVGPEVITKLKANAIVLYTKKDCPYCLGAKNLLKSFNYHYDEIEIKDLNSKSYQEMLALSKGVKTFPQIFIKQKHIGGFKDLKDLNDRGELAKIIEDTNERF